MSEDAQISIHALREESDGVERVLFEDGKISIHALREESDRHAMAMAQRGRYFNPRSP